MWGIAVYVKSFGGTLGSGVGGRGGALSRADNGGAKALRCVCLIARRSFDFSCCATTESEGSNDLQRAVNISIEAIIPLYSSVLYGTKYKFILCASSQCFRRFGEKSNSITAIYLATYIFYRVCGSKI